MILGLLWLLDGILECQGEFFRPDFFGMMLMMNPAPAPGWLFDLGTRIEPALTSHAFAANAAAAALQLLLGLGLLWRRTARWALAASVPWALAVWLFGEAAGGIFGPGAMAITGAPGPALLYALVAVLVWPGGGGAQSTPLSRRRLRGGLAAWVALWLGTAALQAEMLVRQGRVAGDAIYYAGNGASDWLAQASRGVGGMVGTHGGLFCLAAGLAQAAIGLGVLVPRLRRPALAAGAVLGACYGLVGQDLGGIFSSGLTGVFSSGATDPGSGPLIVLLTAVLWTEQPVPDPSETPECSDPDAGRVLAAC